jgi:hypothetical protein
MVSSEYKKRMRIPKSREITLTIPDDMPINGDIEITIRVKPPSEHAEYQKKLGMLKHCQKDPLFLADLEECAEDFKYSDAKPG